MLTRAGIPFTVVPNRLVDEPRHEPGTDIDEYLRQCVLEKAIASAAGLDGLVISADTIVVSEGQVLGKPLDIDDAMRTLHRLSGKAHEVKTGYCLWNTGTQEATHEIDKTHVHIPQLSDSDITAYVHAYDVLDKAGSYGIQDLQNIVPIQIDGEWDTVVGLPIARLYQSLAPYAIVASNS